MPGEGIGPFSDQEIAALFGPLEQARGLVLAVSGGPDSIALMLLAARWAKISPDSSCPISVATVDHGLRAASGDEARQVSAWATAQGLRHDILEWRGAKPKTRIQERAREKRYELLFAHARQLGADHIATAHHADDQAETILFRLLRGSGIAGLAGMTLSSRRGEINHLRPLLFRPKADLVAVCTAKSHPFVRDPSNENPVYARTRLRRLMTNFENEGLDSAAFLRLGQRAARADEALAYQARKMAEALPVVRGADFVSAPLHSLVDEPEEILLRILENEIKFLCARDKTAETKLLRLDRLETLAVKLRIALRQGDTFAATLGGTALNLDSRQVLTIRLETGRRRGAGTGKKP
jgi:tRNA(Ile)-lysidine synthase